MMHEAGMIEATIEGMAEEVGVETMVITGEPAPAHLTINDKTLGHSEMSITMVEVPMPFLLIRVLPSHAESLYL